jgi:hypothetical protein
MRPCIRELCIQELWLQRLLASSLLQEQDEAVYPGALAGEAPDIFTASGAG